MEHEELAYKSELLKAHEKRLRELEIKAATLGVNCPVEIKMEIKDISDIIGNLHQDIKGIQLSKHDDVGHRGQRKVLVIDDDVEWVLDFENRLIEWGYDVIKAFKSVDGVRLVTIEKPDVVLLDLHMPDMHGHNVLLKIVEMRIATRVIILSGIENIGISIFIKSGACDYINKSEGVDRIRSAIERAIELTPTVDAIIENPLNIINPLLVMIDDLFTKRQIPGKSQGQRATKAKRARIQGISAEVSKDENEQRELPGILRDLFATSYRLRVVVSDIKHDVMSDIFDQKKYDDLNQAFIELYRIWYDNRLFLFRTDIHRFIHDLNNPKSTILGCSDLYAEDAQEDDLKQISHVLEKFIPLLDRFHAYLLEIADIGSF